jgi:hypothetical protein
MEAPTLRRRRDNQRDRVGRCGKSLASAASSALLPAYNSNASPGSFGRPRSNESVDALEGLLQNEFAEFGKH